MLHGWREWQRIELAAFGQQDASWVFTKPDGSPFRPDVVTRTFKRIAARTGVPVIRLHDLRHTHATLLIKAGVHLKVVSERLGHSHPTFTMETYQHVVPGMQADAARVAEELLGCTTDGSDLLPAHASAAPGRLKRR